MKKCGFANNILTLLGYQPSALTSGMAALIAALISIVTLARRLRSILGGPMLRAAAFSHSTQAPSRNTPTDVAAKLKSALGDAAGDFFGGEQPAVPEQALNEAAEHVNQWRAELRSLQQTQGFADRFEGAHAACRPPLAQAVLREQPLRQSDPGCFCQAGDPAHHAARLSPGAIRHDQTDRAIVFFGEPAIEYAGIGMREENESPVRRLEPIVHVERPTALAVDAQDAVGQHECGQIASV
jgi:hypothetical protein